MLSLFQLSSSCHLMNFFQAFSCFLFLVFNGYELNGDALWKCNYTCSSETLYMHHCCFSRSSPFIFSFLFSICLSPIHHLSYEIWLSPNYSRDSPSSLAWSFNVANNFFSSTWNLNFLNEVFRLLKNKKKFSLPFYLFPQKKPE